MSMLGIQRCATPRAFAIGYSLPWWTLHGEDIRMIAIDHFSNWGG